MKRILVSVLLLTLLFTGCTVKEKDSVGIGKVSFTVIDGFSGIPIEDVRLVVPECEKELYTDSSGKTPSVEISVLKDERVTIPQDYGTFTVLGYKDGYNEYALFFAQIKEGQERNIKVYMFLKDTPLSSGKPLSTIESPDKQWVLEMVEKYRK